MEISKSIFLHEKIICFGLDFFLTKYGYVLRFLALVVVGITNHRNNQLFGGARLR